MRWRRSLSDYVATGGVLLTDCRTGVKDETGLCHDRTLPGLLAEALGIAIEEYESTSQPHPVVGSGALQGEYTGSAYVDWIAPTSAEALAGYTEWHLKPFAAATRNDFGKGRAYYVGTLIQEPEFYDRLVDAVLGSAGIQPAVRPPEGVEVSVREGDRDAVALPDQSHRGPQGCQRSFRQDRVGDGVKDGGSPGAWPLWRGGDQAGLE